MILEIVRNSSFKFNFAFLFSTLSNLNNIYEHQNCFINFVIYHELLKVV